jgi:hypothetical protein
LQSLSVHMDCSLMNRSVRTRLSDDVRFFLGVARAGSSSEAARVLSVGQVTVGRRIVLFDKRLGVTSLNRTPDGFTVTSAGDAILRQCMAMENAALGLGRIAAGCDSLVASFVRVTTAEAFGLPSGRACHCNAAAGPSPGCSSICLSVSARYALKRIRTSKSSRNTVKNRAANATGSPAATRPGALSSNN